MMTSADDGETEIPSEFLERVQDAVRNWTQQQQEQEQSHSQDSLNSLEREDKLRSKLVSMNPNKSSVGQEKDTANPPPQKKKKIPREETIRGKDEENQKTPTRTLKDIAQLIVDKCEAEDLDVFGFFCCINGRIFTNNKDDLKAEISKCDGGAFTIVCFKGKAYNEYSDPNEEYSKLERMFSPLADLKGALKQAFESHIEIGNTDVMPWSSDFVISEKRQGEGIHFPLDATKGHAYIITGESGSGKSWFATRYLPSEQRDASFIYHVLGDDDAKFGTFEPEDETLGDAYHIAMKAMLATGYGNTLAYEAVSELSRKNNYTRNKAASDKFDALMKKATSKNQVVQDWWNQPPSHELEKLVIIIDEVGKAPDLARGLVDEVRNISLEKIRKKGLAKNVLLVLVGSGLDHYIGTDSLDFRIETEEDATEKARFSKFGTDPSKSEVISLKGPALTGNTIDGIPTKDIMGGTYSQVLATNTRMLTRGVIPVLKSQMNTLRVRADELSSRRVELGSTNVVMDYAARVYIELNGLSRVYFDKKEFEALLLSQFRLLMHAEISKMKNASQLLGPASILPFHVTQDEYEGAVKAGLITSDITSTSKALRYLACAGQTAPLDAQDGVAFEIVLQHHLVRLHKAEYDYATKKKPEKNRYYCGRYTLAQAWPPSSTMRKKLAQETDVREEVEKRYTKETKKNRPKDDIVEIKNILEQNVGDCDLVLRQTVSNVQGADVIVMSVRVNVDSAVERNVHLDLYQAKHYDKVPARSSEETISAFASLGIHYDPSAQAGAESDTIGSLDEEVKTDRAGYSNIGTEMFVEKLKNALECHVQVRRRVVVFSAGWESFENATSWKQFDFEAAKEKDIWIWTREMLEPTISALVTVPALKLSDEC